jgi:hypothetical protein
MQTTREECIFAHRAELPRQKAQDQKIERDKAHNYSASDLLPPIAAAKRACHRFLATYEVCFPRQPLHRNQRPGKPAGLIAATRKPAHMPALAPGRAMPMPTPGSGPRCPHIVASAPQRQTVAKLCVAVTGIRLERRMSVISIDMQHCRAHEVRPPSTGSERMTTPRQWGA